MKQNVYTEEEQLQKMLDELEHAHELDSASAGIVGKRLFKTAMNLAGVLTVAFLFTLWMHVEDAKSKGEIPTVFGYRIYEVKTGSMVPSIPVKSLILSRIPEDAAKLNVGDVVTFRDGGVTITHRIIEIVQNRGTIAYRTKGDNPANSADPNLLTPDRIQAVYVMKLPFRLTSESS